MCTPGAPNPTTARNLNRLSNRESLPSSQSYLGTEDIDRDLEEMILEKTEGVPFFIEEFIKSIKVAKCHREKRKPLSHCDRQYAHWPYLPLYKMSSWPELTGCQGAKELAQTGSVIEKGI